MRAGAVDFLEKPVSRKQLLESVGRAIDVDRSVRRDQRERSEIGIRLRELTTRERQVLERLVLGRTNKRVVRELGISSRTNEVYRRKVMMNIRIGRVPAPVSVGASTLVAMDPEVAAPFDRRNADPLSRRRPNLRARARVQSLVCAGRTVRPQRALLFACYGAYEEN